MKAGVLGVGLCGSWVLSAVPESASSASAVSCTCACVYFLRVGVSMHLLVRESKRQRDREIHKLVEQGISQTCFCLLEWIRVTKNF